jgi:hypothetical protein
MWENLLKCEKLPSHTRPAPHSGSNGHKNLTAVYQDYTYVIPLMIFFHQKKKKSCGNYWFLRNQVVKLEKLGM